MADNRIDIELQDKIDSGIRDKIVAIADASDKADAGLNKLRTSLDSISSGGLSNLQAQLSLTASATSALAAAQTQLSNANIKAQIDVDRLAISQQKLAQATAQTEAALSRASAAETNAATASQRLAQAKNQVVTSALQTEIAQQRLIVAQNQAALSAQRLEEAQNRAATGANSFGNEIQNLYGKIILLVGTYFGVRELTEAADTYVMVTNKIKSIGDESINLGETLDKLAGVAMRTYTPFENVGATYQRLAVATHNLGMTQNQTLTMVETLNKAVQMSGASSTAAAQGLYQLAMGMEADRLQGQHLKSLLSDLPQLGRWIAEALGTNLAGLRDMGSKGQLTAAQLTEALQKIGPKVWAAFQDFQPQIKQSITDLETAWTVFIGKLSASTGAGKAISDMILGIANNLDMLIPLLAAAAAGFTVIAGAAALAGIAALLGSFASLVGVIALVAAGVAWLAAYWAQSNDNAKGYVATMKQLQNVQPPEALAVGSNTGEKPGTQTYTFEYINATIQKTKDLKTELDELKSQDNPLATLFETVDSVKLDFLINRLKSMRQELVDAGQDTTAIDRALQELGVASNQAADGLNRGTAAIADFGFTAQQHLLTLDEFKKKLQEIAHMSFDHIADSLDKAMRHADEKLKALQSGHKASDAQPAINKSDRLTDIGKEWANAEKMGSSDEVYNALKKQADQVEVLYGKESKVKTLEEGIRAAKKADSFGEREGLAIQKYNDQLDRQLNALFKLRPEREAQMKIDQIELQLAARKMSLSEDEKNQLTAKIKKLEEAKYVDQEYLKIAEAVLAPTRDYAAALAASNILLQQGKINQEQYTEANKRAFLQYEKASQPLYEMNKALTDQLALTKYYGKELEIQSQLQQAKNILEEKGKTITKEEAAAIREKVEALYQEKLFQSALNDIYKDTIGKKQELVAQERAIKQALSDGIITMSDYQLRMAQLKVSAADLKNEMGNGSFSSVFLGGIGKMIQGFKGGFAEMSTALGAFFNTLSKGIGDSIGNAIVYAKDLKTALLDVARQALSALISALIQIAIKMLLIKALGSGIFSGMGGGLGFADGGYTGDMPTNKLAGSVHGQEFVMNAATTRRIGLADLTALQQGLASVQRNSDTGKPSASIPVSASGGSTGSGNTSVNVPLKVVNVLDPAIIGDYLSSTDGERIFLNTIRRNANSIKAVVGNA